MDIVVRQSFKLMKRNCRICKGVGERWVVKELILSKRTAGKAEEQRRNPTGREKEKK